MNRRYVRKLNEGDLGALLALEEEVWGSLGIERVSEDVLRAWSANGLLLGCMRDDRLLGYAYGERISFSHIPPYSAELVQTLGEYKAVRHSPGGNALHGVSMVSTGLGTGSLLLDSMLSYVRQEGLCYFVSLARLSGLARFVSDHPEVLSAFDLPTVALLYAHQVVSRIDPALIGPPLQLLTMPALFPEVARRDGVLGRFVRIGKELWGVAETSFEDPESLNYSALLVLSFTERSGR